MRPDPALCIYHLFLDLKRSLGSQESTERITSGAGVTEQVVGEFLQQKDTKASAMIQLPQ